MERERGMNKTLIFTLRIMAMVCIVSYLSVLSFVGFHYGISTLEAEQSLDLTAKAMFIFAALGSVLLELACMLYFIFDINIFSKEGKK